MNETETKTGIIYCRVSSQDQVNGTSLGSQERLCKEYAKRENINVLNVFIEEGESAKTANRTEFNKALVFCSNKKNKVDFFIVYKIDRFARNQDDHVTVKAILKKAGTSLRSVTEQIDETVMGRLQEGILSVFAEFDNNVRTERTSQGMLEQLKQGIWQWQTPLGYYRPYKGANIAPEPTASTLIRLGFEEYSKGIHTFKSIANYLNERGLRTKNGKLITKQYADKILKNPIYYGFMKQMGGHQGSFEAIVSEELFKKCQPDNINSAHSAPRHFDNPLFPLKRIVVCNECKKTYTGSSPRGRHGKKYPYYHHVNKDCDKIKSIPREHFEQIFIEYLDSISPDIEYEKLFKAIVLDIWKNNYKEIDKENANIHREITTLENERQKIFDFHRLGKYTDDDFIEQKNIISQKIAQKRLLLQDKWEEEFEMETVLDYCFSYVRNTSKAWIEANYKNKLRFQNLIFKNRIEFDGEKFGTADLKLIYKINQQSPADKSSMVASRGIEPLLPG